jgi:hypothetical protein
MKKGKIIKGKEEKLSPDDGQKKDWQKVQSKVFEILPIAKCLYIAMQSTTENLDNVEIAAIVDHICTGLTEICEVAGEHQW